MNSITIIGGGLAGLVLANRLAEAKVPVILHEAGNYPKHRVCGEFLCGHGADLLKNSFLNSILHGAIDQKESTWFDSKGALFRKSIPKTAIGLSRYEMDQRLADLLVKNGGMLHVNSRVQESPSIPPGTVFCTGRRRTQSEWLGLKMHLSNFDLQGDLELHLSDNGYVGISRIEDNKFNCCALFRKRPHLASMDGELLFRYIRDCGFSQLLRRIDKCEPLKNTTAAVAGIGFESKRPPKDQIGLGDYYSVIPPFTGNGMSIAVESAFIATQPLIAYAEDDLSWDQAIVKINKHCDQAFSKRLQYAKLIQPLIMSSPVRKGITLGIKSKLIPFNLLFNLTH